MQAIIKRRQLPGEGHAFSEAVSPLLAKLFSARGLCADQDISLALKDLLPAELLGIDRAVELLAIALEKQERIVVVGDFDCDGATSCALFIRAMQSMGHTDVRFVVPNRFEYGYGLTPEIVDFVAMQQPALIVTVDNGIASVDGVVRAAELGISVLVTDHHLPGDTLPQAAAIVNPNQPGCNFPSKHLAGVGVVFYLMLALRSFLRESGWFARREIGEPNLANFLDLVALGTVADVVQLDKNNRILVEQGLKRIRVGRCCVGIKALLRIAGRSAAKLIASDIGFVLGPRLNAAGRLDDISIGIALLLTDDESLADEIARELDNFNKDRRSIERGMKLEAEAEVAKLIAVQMADASDGDLLPAGLTLFNVDWHQGVVGIVASRIKEAHHRPCICFALESDDENCVLLKGSARSINGFHIRDALDLISKRYPDLIEKFGGHAMAAGLVIARDKLALFRQAFEEVASELLRPEDLQKSLYSDGELSVEEINLESAQLVKHGFPWGQSVPEPLFDGEFLLIRQRIVGGHHLKLVLVHPEDRQSSLDAIVFNVDTAEWPDETVERIRLVYSLDVNDYRGQETVQLIGRQIEKLGEDDFVR